jgi:hypothetical protein
MLWPPYFWVENLWFWFDRKLGGSQRNVVTVFMSRIEPQSPSPLSDVIFLAIRGTANCLLHPFFILKDYACTKPLDYLRCLQTFVWTVCLMQWVKCFFFVSLCVKRPEREASYNFEKNKLIWHSFIFRSQWDRKQFVLTGCICIKMCSLKGLHDGYKWVADRMSPFSLCGKDVC